MEDYGLLALTVNGPMEHRPKAKRQELGAPATHSSQHVSYLLRKLRTFGHVTR